jgi:dolichol-phosphate mannosyltransferase
LIPVYAATGLLVTPDGPLLFFWLLTLYAISKALHTQRPLYWTLAGLGFGGALLSKYSAVMLAPSVLVFLLLSPNYRYWLRRPGPWLALAIALLVFSPVVMWNAQHDWASLMYQSGRITERPRNLPWHVTVFWSVQAGILTPLAFALFVATAVRGVRLGWFAGEDKWNFAVAFSLPLFLVLVVASFRQSVHVNWSAPAYLSLVPAAAGLFVQAMSGQPPVKRRRWRVAVWVAGLTCITMIGFGMVSLIWGMPEALAYKHAGGWRDLASHVAAAQEKLATETGQQPFVLGVDKYPIAALMGFYTAHPEQCVNAFATGAHGSGYRYWTDLRKFEGRPAIAVTTDAQPVTLNVLRGQFEQVEPLRLLEVSAYGRPVRTVFLSTCYGYHGSHLNVAFPVAGKP